MRRFRPTRFPRYSTRDCALHGASLSLCARKEKVSKEKARPASGPSLRFATFRVRSLHRCSRGTPRRAVPGPSQLSALASCVALSPASMQSSRHPCRSTPSTPIPLTLLTGLLVRADRLHLSFSLGGSAGDHFPIRRPNAGAVQRGIWHGCQMRNDGPWMALRDDPRNGAAVREVARSATRMPGCVSLLPFFAQAKKGRRPAGRNRNHQSTSIIGQANNKKATDYQSTTYLPATSSSADTTDRSGTDRVSRTRPRAVGR